MIFFKITSLGGEFQYLSLIMLKKIVDTREHGCCKRLKYLSFSLNELRARGVAIIFQVQTPPTSLRLLEEGLIQIVILC